MNSSGGAESASAGSYVAWTLGGLIVVVALVCFGLAYAYLKHKREQDEKEAVASSETGHFGAPRALVKSSVFQAFKASMDAMEDSEMQPGTLDFRDEGLEREYLKFHIVTLCRYTMPLALAGIVKTLWEMVMFDPQYNNSWQLIPTFLKWESSPVVLYNCSWLSFLFLSILVLLLCANPLFRRSTSAENVIMLWVLTGVLVGVLPGNRWRVSRLCGYERPPVSDFPSYQDSDQKMILALLMTLVYMAMYVPVRFSLLRLLGAWMGLLYPLSTLFLMNPAGGQLTFENALMFDGMVALILVGHRCIEKHRRIGFLALVQAYERLGGEDQKAMLY